jgi:peroxiredoxin
MKLWLQYLSTSFVKVNGGMSLETTLKVGDFAPDFSLSSTTKEKLSLSEYRGKKSIVVAFYGMDFTPG